MKGSEAKGAELGIKRSVYHGSCGCVWMARTFGTALRHFQDDLCKTYTYSLHQSGRQKMTLPGVQNACITKLAHDHKRCASASKERYSHHLKNSAHLPDAAPFFLMTRRHTYSVHHRQDQKTFDELMLCSLHLAGRHERLQNEFRARWNRTC